MRHREGGRGMWGELEAYLIRKHEHGFKVEPTTAVVEQVLKGGPQQVEHHYIVIPLHSVPSHRWDSHCRAKVEKTTPIVVGTKKRHTQL